MTGELSEDGNQVTFVIPRDQLSGFNPVGRENILNEDGSTTVYEGNAIVTYAVE